MDFEKVKSELSVLQEQIENNKMDVNNGGHFIFKECFVIREVPKEEWEHLIE